MTEDNRPESHAAATGPDQISSRLHEAIDGLRKDVTRVEVWATALGAFAKPVPDYRPDSTHDLTASEDPPVTDTDAQKAPKPGA